MLMNQSRKYRDRRVRGRPRNQSSPDGLEGLTRYRWDYNNRLTQLDQPGDVHSYFGYDADGKRVTKEDAAGFTRFIYQGPDMLALLQERDAAGNVVAHYTMGDGLEAMRRGEESRFYHYDWLGSTFELTDAAGAVTDSYLYDAWGNALAASGATPNPHRYVGRERYYEMPGTGLYHVGHRQLDTAVGRFLSVDPLGDATEYYRYASNRPSLMVDPQGLSPAVALSDGQMRLTMVETYRKEGCPDWLALRIVANPYRPRVGLKFVWTYRQQIRAAAARAKIPPELVAGTVMAEMESPGLGLTGLPSQLAHIVGAADSWAEKKALHPDEVHALEMRAGLLQRIVPITLWRQVFDTNVATLGPLQIDVNTAINYNLLGTRDRTKTVQLLKQSGSNIAAGGTLYATIKRGMAARLGKKSGYHDILLQDWSTWDLLRLPPPRSLRSLRHEGATQTDALLDLITAFHGQQYWRINFEANTRLSDWNDTVWGYMMELARLRYRTW